MKPVVAFTVGDPHGIGPELVLRTVSSRRVRSALRPMLVGPWAAFRYYADRSGARLPSLLISEPSDGVSLRIRPGVLSVQAGRVAAAALRHAVQLIAEGLADGMVTAPVSKQALHRAGARFPGQTELLRHLTGARHVAMMLVSGAVRIGLATIHVPVRSVPRILTRSLLSERIRTLAEALRYDWGIRRPSIAVLGLNPHAGENGLLGSEEQQVIVPVLRTLKRNGLRISGPFPADAFFARGRHRSVDLVVAMYHDQGLIPLKMIASGHGVNVSAGLPLVRTSPDHGTGFDIAGKGIAQPESMIEAALCAAEIIRQRRKRVTA